MVTEKNNGVFVKNTQEKQNALQSQKLTQTYNLNKLQEEHFHEKEMRELENQFENAKQDKALGKIGIWFGNSDNSSKNITAIICLTLIIGASIVSLVAFFCVDKDENHNLGFIKSMWTSILPIITLSLGYLFGKNQA